ncbi:MAG: transglutaminase family protein [Verrucomicrobia bacterium]|nr:transglutaminase family protein [Verrucomicrobiota bacterium]
MATRIALCHRTTYTYDRLVTLSPHVIRLRPAPHCRTRILSYSIRIEPEEHFFNLNQDPFSNYEARVVFKEPARKFEVVVDLTAEMIAINPFDFFLEGYAETFPFNYPAELLRELKPYLEPSEGGRLLKNLFVSEWPREAVRTNDLLVHLNQHVQKLVSYAIRLEPGVQSCEETLGRGIGSCRDSAYLLVQLLRHMGLAARFVSGYLVQLVPDEKPLEGPAGPEKDFTDLHAWAEVFLPGAGWVGLDPTSGLFASEGHIPLACTPEPSSAAPITGAVDECETEFSYENSVRRVWEDPRVTRPYTGDEWAAVQALGRVVDRRLEDGDVRLTMGGEPTFVSIDDMDGPEWNTTADSPFKRERASELLQRLQTVFAPSGIRWYGEGKWYPGEPVPRWAYGLFWRKDGHALWGRQDLLADLQAPGSSDIGQCEAFARAVADQLHIAPGCVHPALEDAEYYRWKASALPTDEVITVTGESDSLERRTLAALIRRGLEVPSGFVIPVYFDELYGGWRGGRWEFRRGQLFLIPGSSPLGFRLPLDSLNRERPLDFLPEHSPLESLPPLLQFPADAIPRRAPDPATHPELDPATWSGLGGGAGEDARWMDGGAGGGWQDADGYVLTPEGVRQWMPRTALCFEVREQRLHVFFPPCGLLERYLTLLAVVERVAARFGLPVVLEGYEPPRDPRLEQLKVTPDPGVIEVNVHPSRNWEELVLHTETLYREARLSRLGAEKFMLDGRHTGTGGGNHVVIGAEHPASSPFLRRPGLLRSLITYWQHHPGLSFLFSGMFIGPTSQAPRVDQVMEDRLFELDIAFQQLPETTGSPWIVDRALRNLLTDLTGNTHRTEFCIDKLYSPDSASGRLGLLELRAFEMPPHPRMSLVQALLVRALIARFWERPYHHKLVRWGTALHDRFLLPEFAWQDIAEVCLELREAGLPFELDWLKPFHEFRFPLYGRVQHGGVELEIRFALEPWHVLGEERTASGTARYVDSSLERLQVKVRGAVEGKHLITCNGRRLPLFPTGTNQEYVAGVRYKAWAPYSALHPAIGEQTPLCFDIVDERNRKSLGGCVYHVSHPGGRAYASFPVNALEAESRRISRFWEWGHTPAEMESRATSLAQARINGRHVERVGPKGIAFIPPEEPLPEFPATLDLRFSPENASAGGRYPVR